MIHYTIHDVLDVLIDSRVGNPLISAVDFQIGYFRNTEKTKPVAPYEIIVKPYNDFAPRSLRIFQAFHLSRGLQGYCFHDSAEGIAVEKHSRGFKIYSDSPNFLINLYVQLLLIENDYSMVHAASVVDKNDRVTLLPAAGTVGKTALLGYMVEEHGFRHMGDDIIILGKQGNCLSFPRSFVLKEYHRSVYPEVFERLKIKKRTSYALKKFVVENAPFIGVTKTILRRRKLYYKVAHSVNLTPYLATIPVEEIFGPDTFAQRGDIERIVFLERYEGTEFKLEKINEGSLFRRMFAIIHHEWVAGMQQLFTLGAIEIVNLPLYFQRVSEIIRSAISGKECQIMFIPCSATPRDLVDSYLELSRHL